MSYFFLVPALICLFLMMHDSEGGVDTAFLSVYLPTLFLLPIDYTLRIPHLPELSVSQDLRNSGRVGGSIPADSAGLLCAHGFSGAFVSNQSYLLRSAV